MLEGINIVLLLLVVLLAGVAGFLGFLFVNRKRIAKNIEEGQRDSEKIIEEARREADRLVKDALREAKDEHQRRKQRVDEEAKKRQSEIQKLEAKIKQRETSIEKKLELIEKREQDLERQEQRLGIEEQRYRRLISQNEESLVKTQKTLESVANMSADQAKRELMKSLEAQAYQEARVSLREIEKSVADEADTKARSIISQAVQRLAGEYVNDATITVVSLPSDEMKGRIIGREGRNIRAIEQATGVDLIIDDTPEAVIISCFNPIRREIAKTTIERLVSDGRIHPARIEETVTRVNEEFETILREVGEQASYDLGITDLGPELIISLGKLRFRTTGKVTVLDLCMEAAHICGSLADELGLDAKKAKRAALLHKIGKAVDQDVEGHHAEVGAELCAKAGEDAEVIEAIRNHCRTDVTNISPLASILQIASQLSENRPGIKGEKLDAYIKRLRDMEAMVEDSGEITKAYIMQAGREIRAVVNQSIDSDQMVVDIAHDIASRLRKSMNYPGQIRVTVVRENRAAGIAQ